MKKRNSLKKNKQVTNTMEPGKFKKINDYFLPQRIADILRKKRSHTMTTKERPKISIIEPMQKIIFEEEKEQMEQQDKEQQNKEQQDKGQEDNQQQNQAQQEKGLKKQQEYTLNVLKPNGLSQQLNFPQDNSLFMRKSCNVYDRLQMEMGLSSDSDSPADYLPTVPVNKNLDVTKKEVSFTLNKGNNVYPLKESNKDQEFQLLSSSINKKVISQLKKRNRFRPKLIMKKTISVNFFIGKRKFRNNKIRRKLKIRVKTFSIEQFEDVAKVKSQIDIDFLFETLKQQPFLAYLPDNSIKQLVKKVFYCRVKPETYLFKQGESAFTFFIVDKGKCQIQLDGQIQEYSFERGSSFGELALLYSAPRSASIYCKSETFLWGIDRMTFKKVIHEINNETYQTNKEFIETNSFFPHLTDAQKDSISHSIIPFAHKKGSIIIWKGESARQFYMIKKGEVQIYDEEDKPEKILKEGERFGMFPLFHARHFGHEHCDLDKERKYVRTFKAKTDVSILSISRLSIQKIFGKNFMDLILQNILEWAYLENELFLQLTEVQIYELMKETKIKQYQQLEKIIVKDEQLNTLHIVLYGDVKMISGFYCSKNSFNTKSIIGIDNLTNNKNQKSPYDYTVTSYYAQIASISFEKIKEVLKGDILKVVEDNQKKERFYNECCKQSQEFKIKNKDVKLDELYFNKTIGSGQLGSVYLVSDKEKKQELCLKIQSKFEIEDKGLFLHVISEKNILNKICHPFVMKFITQYQDKQYIYFLCEYIKGEDLYDVICRDDFEDGFPKEECQYYIASLILTLKYLHELKIIHRDIKPQNVMIDDKGNFKLLDFGISKEMKTNKTYTVVGTPWFMAPEVINPISSQGYAYSSDIWSVGIVMFNILNGYLPFGDGEDNDVYAIYKEIVSYDGKLENEEELDETTFSFMKMLLTKDQNMRFDGSYAKFLAHGYLKDFNWQGLMDGSLKKPYIPNFDKIGDDDDYSEDYSDDDEDDEWGNDDDDEEEEEEELILIQEKHDKDQQQKKRRSFKKMRKPKRKMTCNWDENF